MHNTWIRQRRAIKARETIITQIPTEKKQSLKNHYKAFCSFLPNLQLSHTQRYVRDGCWFAKTNVLFQLPT